MYAFAIVAASLPDSKFCAHGDGGIALPIGLNSE
jgi:hypothetical protein